MYTIRKLLIALFIFSVAAFCVEATAVASEDKHNQSELPSCDVSSYDDFDAMADEMVHMGVAPEEPKPLSTIDRWVQQICSPIIMKYVLIKGYLRDWGYWMVGIKKVSDKK